MSVNTQLALSLITPPSPLRLEYLSRSYHETILTENRQTALKMTFKPPLLVPRINIPRALHRGSGMPPTNTKVYMSISIHFRDCLRLQKRNMPDLAHQQLVAVIQCGKFPNLGISIDPPEFCLSGLVDFQTLLSLSRWTLELFLKVNEWVLNLTAWPPHYRSKARYRIIAQNVDGKELFLRKLFSSYMNIVSCPTTTKFK